ncbi:hypothetical protein DF057_28755 [Burkholderia cepacia]|uniref:hypothetical protein n=1 Tax=Burkholderia cepacia TaxID=292 RepID=UPI000F5DFCAF|nr:hypothetical protein [Burkholderia cepacia]RQZ57437.1 hypothetical protein DF057_28755 [Burkholderia cepacia]
MSEFLCIEQQSLPEPLKVACVRRTDPVSGRLISFVGCPMTGREIEDEEIEFPFPRDAGLRMTLIDWMLYWGIPFRVMP